jgi:tight adherence protein B
MSTSIVLIALFGCVFLLVCCLLYIFVVVPLRRKEVRRRLESLPAWPSGSPAPEEGTSLQRLEKQGWLGHALAETALNRRFKIFVAQSGTKKTAAYWSVVSLILFLSGCLVALLLQPPLLIALVTIGLLAVSPFLRLAYNRYKRLTKLERQLPDALDILTRAVRAGYAFTSGLLVIADEMPDPIAQEFRKTYEQQNLGLPLRDALYNLSVRVPLPDVRIFVSTLQIQSESGGNLAEVLDKLATVVRERFRLLQQVRIYAAEGKMSMYVLLSMTPFLLVAMYYLNPRYLGRLLEDLNGLLVLEIGVLLQILGYFVIRRLVGIKV